VPFSVSHRTWANRRVPRYRRGKIAMAESPVKLEKVDCGDGKRKMVIREREYDVMSWHGLKTIASVAIAAIGAVIAVVTAYYTAEASQTARIAENLKVISAVDQRQSGREKSVDRILTKLDKTLCEQQILIRENANRLIEVQTTQKLMRENLKEVAADVKKLGRP
jgi:hypothetical protein